MSVQAADISIMKDYVDRYGRMTAVRELTARISEACFR